MDSAPRRSSFAWFSSSKSAAAVPVVPAVPADPLLAFSSEGEEAVEQTAVAPVDGAANQTTENARNKTWIASALVAAVLALIVLAAWPLRALTNRKPIVEFGNLSVTTRPAGAAVLIDGIDRGVTPVTMPAPTNVRCR
jgi:hypothetical protein